MRDLINLILSEVTLSKYGPGTKFLIGGSVAGQALAGQLNNQNIDTTGPVELTNVAQSGQALTTRSKVIVNVGTGDSQYEFADQNGNYFYLTGTTSSIQAAFVHSREDQLSNKGEVSEGILGAAMFAKFTNRQEGEDLGMVDANQIFSVLDRLKQTGEDIYQVAVNDSNNKVADTVTFLLRLKTGPYNDLMNPLKRKLMTDQIASAIGYVNGPRAETYSKYFYLNGKADDIAIMADGAASETEKKADVWVAIKDKNNRMRALKLSTSLKVGGQAQFGQVGGSDIESMTKLFGYFGVDVSEFVEAFEDNYRKDPIRAVEYMYRQIAAVLERKLAGDSTQAEVEFVNGLAHAITFFATLGDPNTELVDFDKGGFKILRFNNLEKKLKTIDLTATYISTKKRPEISIHDVNDPKKELISIRCKVENKDNGPYVRNYIEKGKLLEEITKVQYQAWDELEKPDPGKVRLQIKNPKGREQRSDNIGRSKR